MHLRINRKTGKNAGHDAGVGENIRVEVAKIGAVQEMPQPFGLARGWERSFLVLASFRLSHRSLPPTCSFAKASPKPKNPRSEWPRHFLKRSSQKLAICGLKNPLSTRINRFETRLNPLKATQVVDFPDIEGKQSARRGASFMIMRRLSKLRRDVILPSWLLGCWLGLCYDSPDASNRIGGKKSLAAWALSITIKSAGFEAERFCRSVLL